MLWIDWVIISLVGISTLISLVRGFTREALSLVVWIAAFGVAVRFAEPLSIHFSAGIDTPSLRFAAAFVCLFVVTLIVGALVNFLIGQLVKSTGLSGTDRMLGIFFGATRGVLMVAVAVLLMSWTPLVQDPWWQGSQLIPHFELLANWVQQFLPEEANALIS